MTATAGKCDGGCKEHVGAIRRVRVIDHKDGHDLGEFHYCQAAIDEDISRQLGVWLSTEMPPSEMYCLMPDRFPGTRVFDGTVYNQAQSSIKGETPCGIQNWMRQPASSPSPPADSENQ